MAEAREQFVKGSSTIEGYFGWINERHAIYLRRVAGQPKPWTADPILRTYKFTNAFRELDKGTVALRTMERKWRESYLINRKSPPELVNRTGLNNTRALLIFNTFWYRLFNWYEHATNLGFCEDIQQLVDYMTHLHWIDGRIFTNAHMVRGIGGVRKVFPYLELSKEVWAVRHDLADTFAELGTLQGAFDRIIQFYLMGDFTSYEIVCDLRWHVLVDAPDVLTWGNVGNGAVRGLKRLGMAPTCQSMMELHAMAPGYLTSDVCQHHPEGVSHNPLWPPFELREIEHSLCEFDKYERARLGQGKPRMKYNGG